MVVGQPSALQFIVPYLQTYKAELNPQERPAGVFLLLGPTGTGKTRTVEAVAEILHGSPKHLLRIDCAEYQSDHEVAKLIGAPPGYIGHRETKPLLTQERLIEVVSPASDLAVVLFDEIEKAAPALTQLLLGVLDKATLRVGDNTTVDFEKTLFFLTSNLGARDMLKEVQGAIGFQRAGPRAAADVEARLESIGLAAVRKRFAPEFVNRIDAVITYRPLDETSLGEILDHHIAELQRHVHTRLGDRSFEIDVTPAARRLILERGASREFGARELKRTIHRLLTQPLAALVAQSGVAPAGRVVVDRTDDNDALSFRPESTGVVSPSARPVVLTVDDSPLFTRWLEQALTEAGVTPLSAADAAGARRLADQRRIDLALIDLLPSDGDGLWLAFELLRLQPNLQVVVMTGPDLSTDELALCKRQDFPVLRKPFLAQDLVNIIRARLLHSAAVGG
jgi:ATP-dependent Clp protease ATP-binding subunit ClpA/CheY-like chemotaxis protein